MKSNTSAGFLSKPKNDGKTGATTAKPIEEVKDKTEEEKFKEMEEEVHRLLEDNTRLKVYK